MRRIHHRKTGFGQLEHAFPLAPADSDVLAIQFPGRIHGFAASGFFTATSLNVDSLAPNQLGLVIVDQTHDGKHRIGFELIAINRLIIELTIEA